MKFKVGDKVRVRKNLVVGNHYGGYYYFTSEMAEFAGKLLQIKRVCSFFYNVTDKSANSFYWTDEMLEPAVKTLDNLEVGDILVHPDGDEIKVLAVLGDVFLRSWTNDFDVAYAWVTSCDAKKWRWVLKTTEPENPEETIEIEGKRYTISDVKEGLKRLKK